MAEKDTELIHGALITKDPAKLRLKPNLQGYDNLRKTFKWSDADKMVDWFPGGKINAAYNVIDRHAKGQGRTRSRSSTTTARATPRRSRSSNSTSRRTSSRT